MPSPDGDGEDGAGREMVSITLLGGLLGSYAFEIVFQSAEIAVHTK